MNPFDLAAKQMGMNERDQNDALTEYLANGGVNLDPAVTAWCAAYVNATLAQAGQKGTGSNMARSFLDWGQEVTEPQKGDLAVFQRGDPNGPYGHVGFFDGYNADGTIRVLGGNQGDGVSVASYSPDQLLGFRRGEGGAPVEPDATPARNPAALAYAYANGQMTPEDAAIYERGMNEGLFPKATPKAKQPDPLETYAAVAMRPRQPFQPVALDAGPIKNATPWGRA